MNSSKVSYLFFTLSIILIFSQSLVPTSCKTLYESVCEDTLNGNNAPCLKLLKIDPTILSAKNYVDLTNSILDLAITKATDGQNYISNFNKQNQPPAIQKCATTLYPGSISSFKKAKVELVKDPQTASSDARLAGDGPSNCADAIKAAGINDAIIIYLNTNVLLLSDIASVAARKLVK
ncbi:unnamed protein product [Lupinus luteus]|uniref:Pectinesterase inhibitor domain-containing protein n=1 Tax=Lupinus luteus TaxID=3873 RepID=A0AAV1XP33_LUPLU